MRQATICTRYRSSLILILIALMILVFDKSFIFAKASGSVAVAAPGAFNWTASTEDSFVTITPAAPGPEMAQSPTRLLLTPAPTVVLARLNCRSYIYHLAGDSISGCSLEPPVLYGGRQTIGARHYARLRSRSLLPAAGRDARADGGFLTSSSRFSRPVFTP
jgi:hypothetical protein